MKQPAMLLTLRIPLRLLNRANRAARASDQTLAELLRQAILTYLDEPMAIPPAIIRQRRELRGAIEASSTWQGLQSRLRKLGYVLRPQGHETTDDDAPLLLCSWPGEQPLVPLESLGPTREDLTLRYGRRFPARPEEGGARTAA